MTEPIRKLDFGMDESEENRLSFTIDRVNEIIEQVNEQQKLLGMTAKAIAEMTVLLEVHDKLLKNMFPELTTSEN